MAWWATIRLESAGQPSAALSRGCGRPPVVARAVRSHRRENVRAGTLVHDGCVKGRTGMPDDERQKETVRRYVEDQGHEEVVHLEKVASEQVGPARHDIWDVHCPESRWWVLTNPMNLYSQDDFKSRDVVLSFHVGLMLRVSYQRDQEVPVSPSAGVMLPGSWRRWQQAFEAYDSGEEAEAFQAVGMRLRECLISFVEEACTNEVVPDGTEVPMAADVRAWTELLANQLAPGSSAAQLRSYLKKLASGTWRYVNWLTHAKNATRIEAEIGLKAVEHLLGMFTAARMRTACSVQRCNQCGSYEVVAGVCRHCDWADPSYEAPVQRELTGEELAERLSEPCTPSSDISTFVTPDDLI